MTKSYIFLFLASLMAVVGQVFFKLGVQNNTGLPSLINLRVLLGLTAYGIGTLLWIVALTRVPLHIAYGFTAFSFVLVYLASAFYLKETISQQGLIALGTILLGFLLLITADR